MSYSPSLVTVASPVLQALSPCADAALLPALCEVVRAVAATEVMPRYLKVAHQRKSDGSLFTAADLAAQAALVERLQDLCPVPVVAEEMSREEQAGHWLEGEEGLWCIDPIDGTSNFVNGVPYFAVSVALMRRGRPVLGVVHDPVAGETFYAASGGGAFLDGEPLPIKGFVPQLRNAMAGADLKRVPRALATALVDRPPIASLRSFGAGTLEWCYVAAGRMDVYLHGGQKLWDYAAGSLILAEAGGSMAGLHGGDFWAAPLWQRGVVAALDPRLFEQWQAWVAEHLPPA